jgi:ribosomal protein S27AE
MISFLENFGIKVNATPDGRLTLKGLAGLPDETRQEVLDFARDHKASILSELQPGTTKPSQKRDTCPACGQSQWWRKNEPNSKWICGRCHPPAQGLDAIYPLDKRPKNTPKKRRIGNDTN